MSKTSQPDLPSATDEGDRPSITEVNGTVAHFEMAYAPRDADRFRFGPPLSQRIGSFLFLGFAIALAAAVAMAYAGSSNSRLYVWVVEGDANRALGAVPLAGLILLSAIGTVVRAGMRGVIVTSAGIEARYLLPMGVPRIRKWTWAQIDRFIIDDKGVMVELWNGMYEQLPKVADRAGLRTLVMRVATARKKEVTLLRDDER